MKEEERQTEGKRREKMRERNVGEIGRRTDFVKTSLSTIDQYQKDAQK